MIGFSSIVASGKRYTSKDPFLFKGGQANLLVYAGNDPVNRTDREGLVVRVCTLAAEDEDLNSFGFSHQWIKTDTIEAGMGAMGPNRGMYGTTVGVVDHSGFSKSPGAKCTEVSNVDEEKVNRQLRLGRRLGTWSLGNQCQSFVSDVINNALQPAGPAGPIGPLGP